MLIGANRQVEAGCQCGGALLAAHLLDDAGVVACIHHDIHPAVVLCSGAHHGRAADVDVLDRLFQRAVRSGDGGLEGIQVDHDHIDGINAMLSHHRVVLPATGEDAAVDLRMQCFHTAVHHLGKAGVVGNLGDCEAGIA